MKSDTFWLLVFLLLIILPIWQSQHQQQNQRQSEFANVGQSGKLTGPDHITQGMTIAIHLQSLTPASNYILLYNTEKQVISTTKDQTSLYTFIVATELLTNNELTIHLYGYNSTTQHKEGPLVDQLTIGVTATGSLPTDFFVNQVPFAIITFMVLVTLLIAFKSIGSKKIVETTICPSCKGPIAKEDMYCQHCGAILIKMK